MGLTEKPKLLNVPAVVHILLQAKFAQFKIDQQKSRNFTLVFSFNHVSDQSNDEPTRNIEVKFGPDMSSSDGLIVWIQVNDFIKVVELELQIKRIEKWTTWTCYSIKSSDQTRCRKMDCELQCEY